MQGAAPGPIEPVLMNIAQKPSFVLSQRHLLGIEGLSREEILGLLDLAEHFVDLNRQIEKKQASLRGRTLINLFFEVSTRTQASFELAGKRLGADVMNMSVGSSSMRKGETLIDTAVTLNAMHPDLIVVRHHASGAVELLARKVDCSVINAGDGSHEHPTQALLDALTIRRNKGRIERLVVTICGDILHSRVARSNIILLNALGARVRVVAPSTLLPIGIERFGVEATRDMREGLERLVRALDPGILPLFRPRPEEARLRQAGCAGHAPRTDESRRRDRHRGRRRRPVADPRAGGDGRRRAHGGARGAVAEPAECVTQARKRSQDRRARCAGSRCKRGVERFALSPCGRGQLR